MTSKRVGNFSKATIHDYLTQAAKPEDDQTQEPAYAMDDLHYFYDPVRCRLQLPAIQVPKSGSAAARTPIVGQCLCLDVGCWAGNGPKDDRNHARHRDFGVVCGDIAVLCYYQTPTAYAFNEDAITDPGVSSSKYYTDIVEPFLREKLFHPTLGAVTVRNALVLNDRRMLRGKNGREVNHIDSALHFFIGDLHVPVMSEAPRTFLSAKGEDPSGSQGLRAGRLNLSKEFWGILDELYYRVMLAPAGFQLDEIRALASQLYDLERMSGLRCIEDDGLMSRHEAKEWFDTYRGSSTKKGADIFQGDGVHGAGKELVELLGLLEQCELPINVVQLGDLCDFWIGMKCGFHAPFEESAKATANELKMRQVWLEANPWQGHSFQLYPGASKFFEYWHQKILEDPCGGPAVGKLEGLARAGADHPNLRTTLLYGNHDNYLRREMGRQEAYQPIGSAVWGEHGHQSDSFNCDDDPVLGWAITQLTFKEPGLRDYEDVLAASLSRMTRIVSDDPGMRLQRLARAADVCYVNNRLIYVMAHTHAPMLKRITIHLRREDLDVCDNEFSCALAEAEEAYWRLRGAVNAGGDLDRVAHKALGEGLLNQARDSYEELLAFPETVRRGYDDAIKTLGRELGAFERGFLP